MTNIFLSKKSNIISFGIICSIVVSVAANYDNLDSRSPESNQSYGRLLSNAYSTIVNHERIKGHYDNITFFQDKASSVSSESNPRPLTMNGIVQQKQNVRTLKLLRFELDRYKNGYAGRYAQSDVAMMHAAFDCRVKNIEINKAMDMGCSSLYQKHKQAADYKVKEYQAERNGVLRLNTHEMIDPAKQNQPLIDNKFSYSNQKMNKSVARQTADGFKPVSVPEPVGTPNESKDQDKSNIKNASKPPLGMQMSQQRQSKLGQNININQDVHNLSSEHKMSATDVKNNNMKNSNENAFNPTDYIHPSLRQRAKEQMKQRRKTITDQGNQSNNINKPLDYKFGIMPVTPMKVSEYNYNQKSDKFEFSVDNYLASKPQSTQKQASLAYDPISTASINENNKETVKIKSQKFILPFASSTILSQEGQKNLYDAIAYLKSEKYNNILIVGHADQGRSTLLDQKMSIKRANTIFEKLMPYISENVTKKNGVGARYPIQGLSKYDDNNRRVEIIIN